ncbi:hypothetical protein LDENG_00146150 [Lucifuga dentata]|nr:hypothetical protein LDENG_00146150 [Lucifuga dentata]
MATRVVFNLTTIALCFVLILLSPAPAARFRSSRACCTRYNRKPVPFEIIKGYREQTIRENCRLEAIIFYTVMKMEICTTRRDEWVRKTLQMLSSKLKKMSKVSSAADGATTKTRGLHSKNAESESFFSSTEAFPEFFSSNERLSTISNSTMFY